MEYLEKVDRISQVRKCISWTFVGILGIIMGHFRIETQTISAIMPDNKHKLLLNTAKRTRRNTVFVRYKVRKRSHLKCMLACFETCLNLKQ